MRAFKIEESLPLFPFQRRPEYQDPPGGKGAILVVDRGVGLAEDEESGGKATAGVGITVPLQEEGRRAYDGNFV